MYVHIRWNGGSFLTSKLKWEAINARNMELQIIKNTKTTSFLRDLHEIFTQFFPYQIFMQDAVCYVGVGVESS